MVVMVHALSPEAFRTSREKREGTQISSIRLQRSTNFWW